MTNSKTFRLNYKSNHDQAILLGGGGNCHENKEAELHLTPSTKYSKVFCARISWLYQHIFHLLLFLSFVTQFGSEVKYLLDYSDLGSGVHLSSGA